MGIGRMTRWATAALVAAWTAQAGVARADDGGSDAAAADAAMAEDGGAADAAGGGSDALPLVCDSTLCETDYGTSTTETGAGCSVARGGDAWGIVPVAGALALLALGRRRRRAGLAALAVASTALLPRVARADAPPAGQATSQPPPSKTPVDVVVQEPPSARRKL